MIESTAAEERCKPDAMAVLERPIPSEGVPIELKDPRFVPAEPRSELFGGVNCVERRRASESSSSNKLDGGKLSSLKSSWSVARLPGAESTIATFAFGMERWELTSHSSPTMSVKQSSCADPKNDEYTYVSVAVEIAIPGNTYATFRLRTC